MKRWTCAAFIVVALSIGASAKSKDSSWLRVQDMSSDSPAVDVLANGKPVFKSLSFQAVSEYVEMPAGKVDIQFVGAGGDKDQIIAGCTVKLKSGKYHSLVLYGFFNNHNVNVLELKDEPANMREARLRFVHLSSDTPAVDVQDSAGTAVIKKLNYKKSSKDLALRPGSYAFEIWNRQSKSSVLKTHVKLEPGRACTMFLIGDARDNSRKLVEVVDAGEPGKIAATQEAGRPVKEAKPAKKSKHSKADKAPTTRPAD